MGIKKISLRNPILTFFLVLAIGGFVVGVFSRLFSESWQRSLLGEMNSGEKGASVEAPLTCPGLFMGFTVFFPDLAHAKPMIRFPSETDLKIQLFIVDHESGKIVFKKVEDWRSMKYNNWDKAQPSALLDTGERNPIKKKRKYQIKATVVQEDPMLGRVKLFAHWVE